MPETQIKTKLCLIAGNGDLPIMLSKNALAQGVDLTAIALTSEAHSNLKNITQTHKLAATEVSKIIELCKNLEIQDLTFIGKVPKIEFFKNIHKLDSKTFAIVKRLGDLKDDSLHEAIIKLANENGLEIIEQTKYLKDLFPQAQVFSKRQPDEENMQDVNFGMQLAKEIAALDIGQSVVVQNRSPLAIEAIEGTNECIKRSHKLANGKPIIVCKVSKPNQDQKFDIPTVGLSTLKSAGKNSVVAFEAEKTFFINQEEAIKYADKNNICLMAV